MRLTDPSEAVRGVSPKGAGYSAFGIAPYAAISGASTRSQVLIPSLKITNLNLDFKAVRAEPSWPREGFLKNHAYNIIGDNYAGCFLAAVVRRCQSDSSEAMLTGKLLYKIYGWQGPAARAARRFGRAVGPGEFDRCPGVSKNTGSAKKLLDRFAQYDTGRPSDHNRKIITK